LDTPAGEERVGTDEKSVGPLARERCKHSFDFLAGSGIEDLNLQPHGAGSRFQVSQRGRESRNPITGIAGCCARTASGHAAAPPSVAKNFRRPMWLAMVTLRLGVIHAMEG
jgi:hypothetical protein